jgi:hypothetical protein
MERSLATSVCRPCETALANLDALLKLTVIQENVAEKHVGSDHRRSVPDRKAQIRSRIAEPSASLLGSDLEPVEAICYAIIEQQRSRLAAGPQADDRPTPVPAESEPIGAVERDVAPAPLRRWVACRALAAPVLVEQLQLLRCGDVERDFDTGQ